jgi:hypothetical protein
MQRLRHWVRRLATAWLFSQAMAIAAAPVVLWAAPATAAVTPDEDCCPGLAPGQVCPMHHTKAGARHCAMRSACGRQDAALLTLAGLISVPSRAASAPADTVRPEHVPATIERPVLRAISPESPPPRA